MKSPSPLNRHGPTDEVFKCWFVAYGQYTRPTPAPLPALTSVFLNTAEVGNA